MISKLLRFLQVATGTVAGVFLALTVVLMFVEVLARYFLNWSIPFALVLIEGMLVWGVFLLVGSVARDDGHVRIGFFIERVLGHRAKPFYTTVENIFSLVASSFLVYVGYRLIAHEIHTGMKGVIIPGSGAQGTDFMYYLWVPMLIIPLGFFITSVFYMERIANQVRSFLRRKGREQPEESKKEE